MSKGRVNGARDHAWIHPENWEAEPDSCGAPHRRGPVLLLLAVLGQAKCDVRRLNAVNRMCGLETAKPWPKSANRAGQGMLGHYRQQVHVKELEDFFAESHDQRIVDMLHEVGVEVPHARKYRESILS